jgi:predicted nucleic acid-binding protein
LWIKCEGYYLFLCTGNKKGSREGRRKIELGLFVMMKGKGRAVPLSDALIAVAAARNKMAVLTLDKHCKHLPVELVKTSL